MSKKTNVNISICLHPGRQPIISTGEEIDYEGEFEEENNDEDNDDHLVVISKKLAEVKKLLEKQGVELGELKQKYDQQNPG